MFNAYQFNTAQLNSTATKPIAKVMSYAMDVLGLIARPITYVFDQFVSVFNLITYKADILNLIAKTFSYVWDVIGGALMGVIYKLDIRQLAVKQTSYLLDILLTLGKTL